MEERENVLDDIRNGSDCANNLENYPDTRLRDGVYNIMVSNKTMAVYCDMTTDNGGWTVISVLSLPLSLSLIKRYILFTDKLNIFILSQSINADIVYAKTDLKIS